MEILKQMQHNLYGPNYGVHGNSLNGNYGYNGGFYGNSLYDSYGYRRDSIDYLGRIQNNNGLYSGNRYDNGNLYNSFGSRIGYTDSLGNLRNNLGEGLGYSIR